METGGFNITAGSAAWIATTQQRFVATPTSTQKTRQTAGTPVSDQYKPSSQPIIEAEYVDLYNPIHRPPEQPNQWRNLIIEGQEIPAAQAAGPDTNSRHIQLIARYEQHNSDLPLPGSFVNLLA